jgi:hypothetical protein
LPVVALLAAVPRAAAALHSVTVVAVTVVYPNNTGIVGRVRLTIVAVEKH